MTKDEAETQLRREGFDPIYTIQDEPNFVYDEHTHSMMTTHLILAGSMRVTMEGQQREYRAGERVDVPAGIAHDAAIGPEGCTYVVGEKEV